VYLVTVGQLGTVVSRLIEKAGLPNEKNTSYI